MEEMIEHRVIEGTGEEIAKYTQAHPHERFQLIVLEGDTQERATQAWTGPDEATIAEVAIYKQSLKGKMGVLPIASTSTEAMYD